MKILIVTNMYPSKQKAYAGIFVKNQFEQLKNTIEDTDSIEIFYMPRTFTSKLGSIFKYLKTAAKFIPQLFKKYDIVHLHFFHPLIYLVWIYKKLHSKTKVLVTFHGSDINVQINENNKKHFREIAKIVDFTIPVGETLAKAVNNKLLLKTGKVLPVGVNNNVFYLENKTQKIYDFIFVGSFIDIKGIDVIIQAIKELHDKSISFCFCGSGNYLEELIELKKDFNITIKHNQTQDQLRRLLNQSKFFLIHSRNEGFPTATIEAMYCGLPIVTSNIPQFLEQVSEGINGFSIPLEDKQALINMLVNLKDIDDDKYIKLKQGALNSFKELSLQNVCKQLLTIYKDQISS